MGFSLIVEVLLFGVESVNLDRIRVLDLFFCFCFEFIKYVRGLDMFGKGLQFN